jgi:hypothetical protein
MSKGKLIHIKDYLNTSLDDLKKEMESLDNLMGKYPKSGVKLKKKNKKTHSKDRTKTR